MATPAINVPLPLRNSISIEEEKNVAIATTSSHSADSIIPDWTAEEERKLVRKIDSIVMPLLMLAFFALQLDRGNM